MINSVVPTVVAEAANASFVGESGFIVDVTQREGPPAATDIQPAGKFGTDAPSKL